MRTVLVNAGTDDRVARGQAAITGEGLVGRLTEVGNRAARVLLITDLNSRIPVTIESSHANAVLAGDNSERPRLLYLPSPDAVKIGDRIVTSGEGGVFPPGLPVGVVAAHRRGRAAGRALCRVVAARLRPGRRLRPVAIAAASRLPVPAQTEQAQGPRRGRRGNPLTAEHGDGAQGLQHTGAAAGQ